MRTYLASLLYRLAAWLSPPPPDGLHARLEALGASEDVVAVEPPPCPICAAWVMGKTLRFHERHDAEEIN